MPAETYSPAQAAKQAGIPLSTLRLWCGQYAEFLSPEANPGVGIPRRLTAQDIEVMRAIAQLRHNGLEPGQIVERLRTTPLEDLQPPPAAPTARQIAPETPTTALEASPGTSLAPTAQNTSEAFLAVAAQQLSDVARKVENVDGRLQRVEASRNLVLVAAVAFAAGAVVVAVIAWLVATWAR